MKRNVNMVLLLVIILLTAALIGSSSYQEKRYKNLTTSYHSEMNKMSTELDYFKESFNTTYEELQLKTSREEGLSSQFMTIKSEKEQLAVDKDRLTDEIADSNKRLIQKANQLSEKIGELTVATNQNILLENELDETKTDLSNARNQRDKYKDFLDECGCVYE